MDYHSDHAQDMFENTVKRNLNKLLRTAVAKLRNIDEAEDVVQDVF